MSNQVSFVFTNNSVTVSYPTTKSDGSTEYATKAVVKGTDEYKNVLQAIKEERYDEIADVISPEKKILEFSEGFISVEDGVIVIDGEEVPNELSDRIIKFANEGLPYMPLVCFFRNLIENPSFHSVQQCFQFLEANHYPITPDGSFVAYKKVRANFLDGYTGKFNNSPGQTVSMPRNQVDEDPNQTCSNGLHVASYEYAHNYSGDVMIEVKVNPEHVVAVPNDYDSAKMRVCKYEVLGVAQEKHDKEYVGYASAEQRESWSNESLEDWGPNSSNDNDEYDDEEEDYYDD